MTSPAGSHQVAAETRESLQDASLLFGLISEEISQHLKQENLRFLLVLFKKCPNVFIENGNIRGFSFSPGHDLSPIEPFGCDCGPSSAVPNGATKDDACLIVPLLKWPLLWLEVCQIPEGVL